MGKLPTQKKILREDLKDAPNWVNPLIDTTNSFMETVYQNLNHNITFGENVACFIKELAYKTPPTYPVMENVEFLNELKTKPVGVQLLQALDRETYLPVLTTVYVPWVFNNGSLIISPIQGLSASKTYAIRLLII
jgi:hypothetical protein